MGKLIQYCVSCEQPNDELEMTSEGLMCWDCIEDQHLDDIKED